MTLTSPSRPLAAAPVFDRQVAALLAGGHHWLAGLTTAELRAAVEPLRDAAMALDAPSVIVLPGLDVHAAMKHVELDGRPGFTTEDSADLARFAPVPELVQPPDAPAYLLVDVDAGRDLRNVTPDDALLIIRRQGRSPLTLQEGLAVVTQRPEILRDETPFSMLASRCGDRRVTALWLSRKRPRLGWCWAGNPHTWLGSASCARRVAV